MKRLYALILLLFSLILPFDGQDGSFLRAQGNDLPFIHIFCSLKSLEFCIFVR